MMYALVGVVLFVVRKFNDTVLPITALVLLLQPIAWGRYIHYLINNDYLVPTSGQGTYWKLLGEE